MRNDMALSSLGFLSCLIYPILSAGEGGNLETPMGAEKKFQQKRLWTFPLKDKRGGEGQPAKTTFLASNFPNTVKHYGKLCGSHPIFTSEKVIENLDFYSYQAVTRCPKHRHLPWWC